MFNGLVLELPPLGADHSSSAVPWLQMSPVARQAGGDTSLITALPSPVDLFQYVPACQLRDVGQGLGPVARHLEVVDQQPGPHVIVAAALLHLAVFA